METISTDILIIGGGSAGAGAALKAIELSKGRFEITIIEKNAALGGTSTLAGINCWEPGIGGPGVHMKIAASLLDNPMNAGIGKTMQYVSPEKPWGLSQIVNGESYESTLKRSGIGSALWRRFLFESDAMQDVMQKMMTGYRFVKVLLNTAFVELKMKKNQIEWAIVQNQSTGESFRMKARVYVDCSADIVAARKAGCKWRFGEESHEEYGEPSAPDSASQTINGITLVFRVRHMKERRIEDIPEEFKHYDVTQWMEQNVLNHKLLSQVNEYPNGDLNFNMLPAMEGEEYIQLGEERAYKACQARIYHYWRWLQTEKGFDCFSFMHFFPVLGVRESFRLIGKHVLSENDIRDGFLKQNLKEEVIAFGDHALDNHGNTNVKGLRCAELEKPYGIPYSCLVTCEVENLIVACRGASFSHIAASSCRLSRTMMAIGEAAGAAAVQMLETNCKAVDVDVKKLRTALNITHYENMLRRQR